MFQKYAPAFLNLLFVALVALKTLTFNVGSIEQFALLIVGAVSTFFLPLVAAKWKGALKTGSAIVVAALTALIPLASQGWHLSGAQIITVVLAAVVPIGVQFGVYVRVNSDPVISGKLSHYLIVTGK